MSSKGKTKQQIKKVVPHKKVIAAKPQQSKRWLIALFGVIVLTFIIYIPALKNFLTGWDDKDYIIINKLIHNFNFETVKNIFSLKSGFIMGNYHPITILSYAIEYHYAKINPSLYHVTNVIIHLLNILMVFLFIKLLTRNNYLVAFITSLLFAIHPMHVESVAWVAEQKDLLYTFFELAALCAYILYINKNEKKWIYYFLCLILFIASILSKGMAVAMAALLPLIDYYLGRKFTDKKIWIEKIPFFVIAIFFGLIATKAQQASSALVFTNYSFYDRVLFAGYGIITYLWKCILPVELSCFYGYPGKGTYGWYIIYVVASLGIAWLVYRSSKRTKEIMFGVLFFLFSVALVLQVIPVGAAVIAERYTYVAYIGLFFLIGQGISYVLKNRKKLSIFVNSIIVIFVIALTIGTFNRCKVWKDTLSIWNDALGKDPDCIKGLNGRGDAYNEKRQYDLAIKDLDKALQLKVDYTDAYYNRGISYYYLGKSSLESGQKEQAVKYIEQSINDNTSALKYSPNLSLAYFNRSGDYFTLGNYNAALADVLRSKELGMDVDPEYIKALEAGIKTDKK